METRIENLGLSNKPTGNTEIEARKEIIERYAKEGFHYQGFVPVKMGPSGKILAIDLIFQK